MKLFIYMFFLAAYNFSRGRVPVFFFFFIENYGVLCSIKTQPKNNNTHTIWKVKKKNPIQTNNELPNSLKIQQSCKLQLCLSAVILPIFRALHPPNNIGYYTSIRIRGVVLELSDKNYNGRHRLHDTAAPPMSLSAPSENLKDPDELNRVCWSR